MNWKSAWVHIDDITNQVKSYPYVANQNPAPEEKGVYLDQNISLDLINHNENIFVESSINVTLNGEDAIINGIFQSEFFGPSSPDSDITEMIGSHYWKRIVIDPSVDAISLGKVEVHVTAETDAGTTIDETYSFYYRDESKPTLIKILPIDRNIIRLKFSQNVIDTASSVSVNFPWGVEDLTYQNGQWIMNPLSCPWVKTQSDAIFELNSGVSLSFKINKNEYKEEIINSVVGIDSCVTELNNILSGYDVIVKKGNGEIHIQSLDYDGSIEILKGGVNNNLKFKSGEFTKRLVFDQSETTETLEVTTVLSSGLIFTREIKYSFSDDNNKFILLDELENFDDSILDVNNYTLSYDEDKTISEIKPVFIPEIKEIKSVSSVEVDLYTKNDLTANGNYIITVQNIKDVNGNVIDSDYNTLDFKGFLPTVSSLRKFNIYDFFPEVNRNQDENYNFAFKKFCSILQEITDQLLFDLDENLEIDNIQNAPEWAIEGLLESYGNPFIWFDLSLKKKRQLLTILFDFYRQKGTEKGIQNALQFFFNFDAGEIIFLYYWGDGWILVDSELGVDTELNSEELALRYSFSLEFTVTITDRQKWQIRRLVDVMKPAHIHLIDVTGA